MTSEPPPTPTNDPPNDDSRLARILDACLADLEAGRPIEVERLLAEHPTLAPRLRTCLAGMQLLQAAAPTPAQPGAPAAEETPSTGVLLGDFQILREVGRGGMGVVYEAEQISLRRRVALKVLPYAATLDPRRLQRFLNEAQAAAQLQHNHVVPVYAVGCEQGIHFYAMRFVDGRGLDAVVRELRQGGTGPSWLQAPPTQPADSPVSTPTVLETDHFRTVARLGAQAAAALEHAHQMGVVHRDVKPANLLLENGHLWVTDFGLAQMRGDERLTRTGEMVGTLRYASPEQALGHRVTIDHRSDVYSLGATLYELLTLRPMFSGANASELLRQVAHEEPIPPRRINPTIPRDLEVIILAAVAKEREERYQTAQALADDLNCFLEQQPILARPPTLSQRVWKWAGRHRAMVLLGSSSLLVVLVLAVVALSLGNAASAERGKRAEESLVAKQKAFDAEVEAKNKLEEILARERQTLYYHRVRLAHAAWQDSNVSKANEYLLACRPELGQPDLRGWEWHYLHRLCNLDQLTLAGLAADPNWTAVAISLDGKRLASLSFAVRVWDLTSGKLLHVFPDLPHDWFRPGYRSVGFSHDRKLVAAAGAKNVLTIWSADDGRKLHTLVGCYFSFSADGKHLITSDESGSTVRLYDPKGTPSATWRPGVQVSLRGRNRWGFSHDGRLVAAPCSDRTVRVWDAQSGKLQAALSGHDALPVGVAFSPDGRTLASLGAEGTVKIWDLMRASVLRSFVVQSGADGCLAFTPDGQRLLVGGADGTLKFWDQSGRELGVLRGHSSLVHSVAFDGAGQLLASTAADGRLRLWDARAEPRIYLSAGKPGPAPVLLTGCPTRLLVASPGKGEVVKVWDPATGQDSVSLPLDHRTVLQVMHTPAGDRLFAVAGNALSSWDAATGQWQRLDGPVPVVSSAAMSPIGTLLAVASADQTVKIRDWKTGQVLSWNVPGVAVTGLTFSPDGKRLAGAVRAKEIQVWDVASGRELVTCIGHRLSVTRVEFSPDGRLLASASASGMIRLWDADTGRQLHAFERPGTMSGFLGMRLIKSSQPMAFSPDGKRLAGSNLTATVSLWDVETGEEVLSLRGHHDAVTSVRFSPDGQFLVSTGTDGATVVWNAVPVVARKPLEPPPRHVLPQKADQAR